MQAQNYTMANLFFHIITNINTVRIDSSKQQLCNIYFTFNLLKEQEKH